MPSTQILEPIVDDRFDPVTPDSTLPQQAVGLMADDHQQSCSDVRS